MFSFAYISLSQYLNYQKNNKTIIYRMLDVANQVDWVSSVMEFVFVFPLSRKFVCMSK